MATINAIASGDAGSTTPKTAPAPFFENNAKYLIDPTSDTDDLGNDIGCLCESLVATLTAATVDAHCEDVARGLANAALYLAQQVSEVAREFIIRTHSAAASQDHHALDKATDAPASTKPADVVEAMGYALNDAANAHHAIRATLDAMQEGVYRDLDESIGIFEAAVASTERLDRALSRGLQAWGGPGEGAAQ